MQADMLTLITSNSMNALADALAARQQAAGLHPLRSTTLIVPSLAHSRWVRLALAQRMGAAASLTAQFPAQFIWQLTTQLLAHVPGVERASPVPGEQLRWWVFDWLTQLNHAPQQDDANALLHALCAHETERYKLAEQITRLIGNYWVHRPEWLLAWQEGKPARGEPVQHPHLAWQRQLWRYVAQQTGLVGKRHPFELLAQQLKARSADASILPPRLVMFGVQSLAPLYLQVFAEVAEHTALEIYALSPSEQYWGDMQDARAMMRYAKLDAIEDATSPAELQQQDENEEALSHEPTSLLATWGKQARDFHAALMGLSDSHMVHDEQCFIEPSGESALTQLQHEWLSLEVQPQWDVSATDQSIHLHGCTSLQRQVEVLHEALAQAFAADASLKPSDIAVLACDLGIAAPHIHSVFGAHADRPMPYTVTGMPDQHTWAYTACLHCLLLMGQGFSASALHRFEADAVLRFIHQPLVAARFEMSESDVLQIERWVRQHNIRNGYGDEPEGMALSHAHSWQAGLARVHAGLYATDEDTPTPGWIKPGQMKNLLHRLQSLLSTVAACRDDLRLTRDLASWQHSLHQWMDQLFAAHDEPSTRWLLDTREAINALALYQPSALREQRLSAQTLQRMLSQALRTQAPGAVPGGGITVAQLGELRGLPYRHIVVLGIDQYSFTPKEPRLEFDLMLAKPRKGDRASRADDQAALLDVMLCATQQVSLYAQTQHAQTGDALPLPAAVQALLTQIQQRTQHSTPARAWVSQHAKQRFSPPNEHALKPIYTQDDIIISPYNIRANDNNGGVVYDISNTEPASLEDHALYLAAPAAMQLQVRFGVSLRDEDDEVQALEPAQLVGLEAWLLDQALITQQGNETHMDAWLPPGVAGMAALQDAQQSIAPYVQAQAQLASQPTGSINTISRSAYRQLKLHDLAWLGLQQAQRALQGERGPALCVGSEQVMVMQTLPAELAQQLSLRWQAAWQRDALKAPWLPTDSTWAWVTAQCTEKRSKKDTDIAAAALQAAQNAWQQEREQPLWQCLLPQAQEVELPALEGWQAQAQSLFGELLPYVKIVKLKTWLNSQATSESAND